MKTAGGRGSRVPAELGRILARGGELGEQVLAHDWAATPIGAMSDWPQSLRTAVSVCIRSRFPIVLWWGPEMVLIYNEAYAPMLGRKHPDSMGGRGQVVWREIWDFIGPMLTGVLERGEATWSDNQLLMLERDGYPEECYFTFSYSPIADERGIGGIFTAVTETTGSVLSARRMATLNTLAQRLAGTLTVESVLAAAVGALAENPRDHPFVEVIRDVAGSARVAARTGRGRLRRKAGGRAFASAGMVELGEDEVELPEPRANGADWAPALAVPITAAGLEERLLLVTGTNPQRRLDHDYRSHVRLVADAIGSAVADAIAYDAERRRAEALEELDQAKTRFFTNISHEFRTPLTLLLAPVEDALRGADPPLRAQLELVHRNALRLMRLVNVLLEASRLDAGQADPHFAPIDLASFVADVASGFQPLAVRAGLALEVTAEPGLEPVFADPAMLEKVVLNLLSNAFKFTHTGGIEVRVRQEGREAVLSVKDTGIGVPADQLPLLFDRFHTVAGASGRTQEGSGLGLALVKQLVEVHDGAVEVESEVGAGSEFRVRLPVGAEHLSPRSIVSEPAIGVSARGAYLSELEMLLEPGLPAQGGRSEEAAARILVVDDNADMRRYIGGTLARHWSVELAGDGQEALDLAVRNPPDLVVTDVMMPRLDGFGLLRALRDNPDTSHIPIVVVSARAGSEAAVEGLALGADDYLAKPFVSSELVARVRATLELSLSRRRAQESAAAEEAAEAAQLKAVEALTAVAQHGGYGGDIGAFFLTLSRTVAGLVGARRVAFYSLSEDSRRLSMIRGSHGFEADPGEEPPSEVERADFEAMDGAGPGAPLAVPWRAGDANLGYLCAYESEREGGFDSQDRWLLAVAAATAALVWQLREARSAGLEGEQVMARMIGAAQSLSSLRLDEVEQAVARTALDLVTDGDPDRWRASFARVDGDQATVVAAAGHLAAEAIGFTYTLRDRDLTRRAFGSMTLETGRFTQFGPLDGLTQPLKHSIDTATGAWCPVVTGDRSHWLLTVIDERGQPFSAAQCSRLVYVATLTGLAISNANRHAALERDAERTRELDRVKSEFLKLASHELRGPLATIRGYATMLADGSFDNRADLARQALTVLEEKSREMESVVSQLLEAARLEDNRLTLRRQEVDLDRLVREAVEAVGLTLPATHALVVEGEEREIPVDADPGRIKSIVTNLLDNAVKYSPEGGQVRVRLSLEDGAAAVAVSDAGIGIAESDIPFLFTRFGRIVTPENSHIPGTGLGLHLAREIARMHGGDVTLRHSRPGAGSEFELTLPALPDPPAEPEPAAPAGIAAGGARTGARRQPARSAAAHRGGRG